VPTVVGDGKSSGSNMLTAPIDSDVKELMISKLYFLLYI